MKDKLAKYIIPLMYVTLNGILYLFQQPKLITYPVSILLLISIFMYYKNASIVLVYCIFSPFYLIRLCACSVVLFYEAIRNIYIGTLSFKLIKDVVLYKNKQLRICSFLITFYIFCLGSFIVNQFIDLNIMSLFAYISTAVIPTATFLVFYKIDSYEEQNMHIKQYIDLCILQIIPVSIILIKAIFTGKFHQDFVIGNFNNANQLSIALIIAFILTMMNKTIEFRRKLWRV